MENIVIVDYAASIRFHINTEGLHSDLTFIKAEIKVLDDTFLLLVITDAFYLSSYKVTRYTSIFLGRVANYYNQH